ncbi:hypothetical protein F4827_006277 [Paraburkholderia bannensis]|uniref:Uncharacterized protein n=1 Tax=Paraburkholderia bannensis TaxID=765414 RepID=A0A7W9U3L4_9BURK|nr:hypothetical protein [Paraburkholderia sp. WP4_3_2]MBB6106402.1 hypothetical protein [Paraburkholderia bannensis]
MLSASAWASGNVVAHDALQVFLRPTMHLFYRHRVIDVRDSQIKYLDGWDGPTLQDSSKASD